MPKKNDVIGPYTLISKLGRGAFGVVWLAEKRSVLATTKVALKIPNDDDVDLNAVQQEASVWVQASGHPNVLPIIDADVYDEQVVIVSEYAPDGSLTRWLEKHGGKAPSLEAAVEMTLGILAGLEHLHEMGIIHRDLKPDNILLQRETPRLADFGIARILKTTSRSTVATGTPAYMPPEAFDGKRSRQTDIWSVGVIFYQPLVGRLPFPQTDISSLLAAIITKEPEPVPESIPERIRGVVECALKKNPDERWTSAGVMRKVLRHAVHTQGLTEKEERTEVVPSGSLPETASAEQLHEPAPTVPLYTHPPVATPRTAPLPDYKTLPALEFSTPSPTHSRPRSRPALWIGGGALALLIIGVVIIAIYSYSASNEDQRISVDEAYYKGIAATVNGRNIMLSEVDKLISEQVQGQQAQMSPLELTQARLQVLNTLVQKEVLFQRAEKERLLPSDEEVTQFIVKLKQDASMTEEQFQKRLKEQGQTLESLREEARKTLAIQKLKDKVSSKVANPSTEVVGFLNDLVLENALNECKIVNYFAMDLLSSPSHIVRQVPPGNSSR